MEHRNVHDFLKPLFDDETFRRLDVLKVDAAKGRTHQRHGFDNFFGVFGVQFDVDGVHIGKAFEQNRLAFHHWLGRQRAKIAHAQDRRAVGNHRHKVALDRIVIGGCRIVRDGLHRNRNAGGIGQRQIALRRHRNRGCHLELTGAGFQMIGKRLFGRDFRFGHQGAILFLCKLIGDSGAGGARIVAFRRCPRFVG
jgi:hypothetical protein